MAHKINTLLIELFSKSVITTKWLLILLALAKMFRESTLSDSWIQNNRITKKPTRYDTDQHDGHMLTDAIIFVYILEVNILKVKKFYANWQTDKSLTYSPYSSVIVTMCTLWKMSAFFLSYWLNETWAKMKRLQAVYASVSDRQKKNIWSNANTFALINVVF